MPRARVVRQRNCPIGELLGPDREDLHLEYKSTLRWDIRAESKKTGIPEKAVVKTVAGFFNSEFGGTLVVGVADDGSVHGLEADFAVFEGSDDADRKFWWRYPTGTKEVTSVDDQQRIIRRRFGLGGGPAGE